MADARIVGALLAAGRGSRFGGNKLEARIKGQMIGESAAQAMAGCGLDWNVAICGTVMPKLDAALDRLGFWRVANPAPEQGLSQSLRLAAQYALDRDADGILVCLGDMPYVETSHLQQIVHAFDRNGRGSVIASRAESYLGPPALFPRSAFVRLLALSGDRGAKDLLRDAIPVSASAGALADIDTRDDLVAREEPPSGPDCGA